MAIRAGFHGTVGQPSAQVIDGSLKFDGSESNKLTKTFGSSSNRTTWTWSGWVKKAANGKSDDQCLFGAYNANNDTDWFEFGFGGSNDHSPVDKFYWTTHSTTSGTTAILRDNSAWYHCLVTYDGSDIKVYINSSLELTSSKTGNLAINANFGHSIGMGPKSSSPRPFFGSMSQVYLIDGQALGPENFGFTDGLTNTWRPKKYTGTFGSNGFYLPMDGNSPIGQDKSGKGNDWTPVNFGGSAGVDKATGALPILNTTQGGTQATVGVRTDANHANLVLALPLVSSANDVSNSVNSGSTTKSMTSEGDVAASTAQSNFYGGSYYFDGTGDYIHTPDSADYAMGTGDFTVEMWINPAAGQNGKLLFAQANGGYYGWCNFYFDSGALKLYTSSDGNSWNVSNLSFGTPLGNAWSHVAVTRSGSTFTTYLNGVIGGTATNSDAQMDATGTLQIGARNGTEFYTGYIQDVRIYKGIAKYGSGSAGDQVFIPASTNPDILPDTPSGVSGGSKLTKITEGAVAFDGNGDYLELANSTDLDQEGDFTQECFYYQNGDGQGSTDIIFYKNVTNYGYIGIDFGGTNQIKFQQHNIGNLITGPVMATKRWYHLAATRSGSTVRLFVDGVLVGSTTYSTDTTGTAVSRIGGAAGAHSNYGFISNLRILKGTALYTSNFTPPTEPLTNVTNTKLLCCQSNSSATEGAVKPGTITANGNATATNFNPFNTDINTVRGQETGYCTLNALDTKLTQSNGNLNATSTSGVTWVTGRGTLAMPSGKFYWEVTVNTVSHTDQNTVQLGIGALSASLPSADGYQDANAYVYVNHGQEKSNGGSASSYGVQYTAGDTVGVTFDADTGTLAFYVNGSSQGNAYTGLDATKRYAPLITLGRGGTSTSISANWGQKPFKFPPPEGFQPLNGTNLIPETVIARPDQYVSATPYTGNNTVGHRINVGFDPDLVIFSRRNNNAERWTYDTVRGAGKALTATAASGEADQTGSYNFLKEFVKEGFTLGNDQDINGSSSNTYVTWNWKAGGNKNTFNVDDVGYASAAAAGLTGGDITPVAASVGTKQGFSIIQYQGNGSRDQSIPHGLTQAPDFSIIKNMDGTNNWTVFHRSVTTTNQKVFYLNTTGAVADYSNGSYTWWHQLPGASLFYIGDLSTAINNGTNDMISYHWHNVSGLQKFGSYLGNTTEGPFVELGFRPAIILIKCTTANWYFNLQDSKRSPINPSKGNFFQFNSIVGEGSASGNNNIDFLSNGFKIRSTTAQSEPTNLNGETYIYAAWAEAPAFNLFGGQSNAR